MKYARWKRRTHLFKKDDYVCSACHKTSPSPAGVCPCCGAPMKSKYAKQARWLRSRRTFGPDVYICSACRKGSAKPYVACPSCGAAMKIGRAHV